MNLIDSLRQSLDNQPDYERPQLSDIEKGKIEKMARRLASIKDDRLKMTYYLAVYIENARLLKECNEHRNARGFKPLASMTIPGTNEPG